MLICTRAHLMTTESKVNKQVIIIVCTQERQKTPLVIQGDHLCQNCCGTA